MASRKRAASGAKPEAVRQAVATELQAHDAQLHADFERDLGSLSAEARAERRAQLHELAEWHRRERAFHSAIDRWQLGDREPLAAYVRQFGAAQPHERDAVADALQHPPSPKLSRKWATVLMLRHVHSEMLPVWQLAVHGRRLTQQEVFELVAPEYGYTAEAVEKAWKRLRQDLGQDPMNVDTMSIRPTKGTRRR